MNIVYPTPYTQNVSVKSDGGNTVHLRKYFLAMRYSEVLYPPPPPPPHRHTHTPSHPHTLTHSQGRLDLCSREGELLRDSTTHEAWWSRVNGSSLGRFTVSSTLCVCVRVCELSSPSCRKAKSVLAAAPTGKTTSYRTPHHRFWY